MTQESNPATRTEHRLITNPCINAKYTRDCGSATLILLSVAVLLLSSIYAWRLVSIRYDFGNFDTILASESPTLAIMLILISAGVVILGVLRSASTGTSLFLFAMYIYTTYTAPYIANSPFYIHRDVFLHLPYSLVIAERGRISTFTDRPDVLSYPGSFVSYAVYLSVVGISDPRTIGLAVAILYPLMLLISLTLLARAYFSRSAYANAHRKLFMVIAVVLPFISRYAPAPGFPHRFHLAFIQTTLFLYVLARSAERRPAFQEITCATLLFTFLVFTHPFFSFQVIIIILTHFIVYFLRGGLKYESRLAPLYFTLLMVYIVHTLYLTYAGLLSEAYRILLLLPQRLTEFVEISLPVRASSVNPVVVMVSAALRNVWRAYIIFAASYIALAYLSLLLEGVVKYYAFSLAVASLVVSPMLVTSFLWWERSLTFVALTLLCALCEILVVNEKVKKRKLLKLLEDNILLILFASSILLSPLIRWERPLLADNWQGYEKETFMSIVATSEGTSKIYMGYTSSVDYTYYRVYLYPHSALHVRTVFDPVEGVLTKDVSKLEGIYAVSVRDPDFEVLNFKTLLVLKSLVWSTGISYVFS